MKHVAEVLHKSLPHLLFVHRFAEHFPEGGYAFIFDPAGDNEREMIEPRIDIEGKSMHGNPSLLDCNTNGCNLLIVYPYPWVST